jgi:hypothetical protein
MPDKRKHRGPNPKDAKLFAPDKHKRLRAAVDDYSWLLERGYPEKGTLKLVGDRHRLQQRQRMAVHRSGCAPSVVEAIQAKVLTDKELAGQDIWIDGLNLLIIVESMLSGGVVLIGKDGALRDLASVHGTYRQVMETPQAVQLIGQCLGTLQSGPCHWFLDRPVSNSGRLKKLLEDFAERNQWDWTITLVNNPDKVLVKSDKVVISSDNMVLQGVEHWFNLPKYIMAYHLPDITKVSF